MFGPMASDSRSAPRRPRCTLGSIASICKELIDILAIILKKRAASDGPLAGIVDYRTRDTRRANLGPRLDRDRPEDRASTEYRNLDEAGAGVYASRIAASDWIDLLAIILKAVPRSG